MEYNFSIAVNVSSILTVKDDDDWIKRPFSVNDILINLSEKDYFIEKLNLTAKQDEDKPKEDIIPPPPDYGRGFTYLIWIDKSIIDPTDTKITKKRLTRLERKLESAVSQYDVTIEMNWELLSTIEHYNVAITLMRVFLIGFTLPLIVLGIYLGVVCVELGMSERRREIGILKSRGATNRHIFSMLLTQSVVLGIIAGILGIVFGVLVSKFIMIYFGSTFFDMPINILETRISMTSVLIAIIFAVIFMVMATYRPAKRASNLSITESLQFYTSEEAKLRYKPTWDIIFLGLGIFAYCGTIFLKYFREEGAGMIFFCLLLPLLVVLIPLSPFFFIFGITRLLTRSSTKIYDYCSRITKFFTKDLCSIVNKNVVRNPRRVSNVCVIIAIGVALGILISTVYGTEITCIERRVKGEVGSDISLATATAKEFKSNLTKIEGVEEVTPMSNVYTDLSPKVVKHRYTERWEGMIALDTESYMKTAYIENYHFADGDTNTLSDLSKKGNVLASKEFADRNYYEVGDTLTVTLIFTDENGTAHKINENFSIIGIVKVLPGSGGIGTIFADYKSIEPKYISNSSTTFLVKVSKQCDPKKVRDKIKGMDEVVSIRVYQEEIEKEKSGEGMLIIDFMLMEYAFIILVVAAGLSVIMYMACIERENELANIVARGASTKQVSSLLLGESVTIIIIGMGIGCVTGIITAYAFNELLAFFSGEMMMRIGLGRPLIIPMLTPILLGIVTLSLILGSFIATIRIRRMDLGRVLKRRGG
jgi:putative ABC transport system permease protein